VPSADAAQRRAADEEQAKQGVLSITSSPRAALFVNDKKVGTSPTTVRVAPGEVRVMLFHRDYGTRHRDIQVAPGERRTLYVDLSED
jgi:hypothetical protein